MVLERIKNIISQQLSIDKEKICLETTLEELEIDSLEVFEMILNLEEEFDIEISNDDIEQMKNVENIVIFINERLK